MIFNTFYSLILLKQSWLESLKALAPKRLASTVFLVRSTLMHLLAAWRMAPWVFLSTFLGIILEVSAMHITIISLFAFWITYYAIVILLTASAVRASVAYKNTGYFITILAHATLLLPVLIVVNSLVLMRIATSIYSGLFIASFLVPWTVFVTLFWLDAQTTMRDYLVSGVRAGILVVYNYPFCLVAYLLLLSLVSLIREVITVLGFGYTQVGVVIVQNGFIGSYILYIIVLTNFYIKRVHDQFSLYY